MSFSPNASPYRAVLFDLDGTLLDTLDDIASAANRVLETQGFPTHPTKAYLRFVGEGVARLFAQALPMDAATPERITACAEGFRGAYDQTWNVASRLYDGIPELLDALVARGLPLAVLSNKPDLFTQKCVQFFLSRWPFDPVHGEGPGFPRKPDPQGARAIAGELGFSPESILYLGDTPTDMTTAQRAGMTAVGASWGFRTTDELWNAGANAVIDHPADLLAILDGTQALRPAPPRGQAGD